MLDISFMISHTLFTASSFETRYSTASLGIPAKKMRKSRSNSMGIDAGVVGFVSGPIEVEGPEPEATGV